MTTKLVVLAALGMAFAAGAAHAACPGGAPMAGVVESVRGPQGGVVVVRSGQRIYPVTATVVCGSDLVQVGGAGAAIQIRYADGGSRSYNAGSFSVPNPAGASRWGRAFEGRVEAFAPDAKTYGRSMVTRGGDPTPFEFEAATLTGGSARLSGGWRDVDVRWFGGVGPFTVTMTGPAGPVSVQNIEAHEARLPTHLAPGHWTVQVQDLAGRKSDGAFTVDPALTTPTVSSDGPFAEWDDALDALSIGEKPELVFEAQQVMAHAPAQGLDRDAFYRTLACRDAAAHARAVCGDRH
ncbi:MAG TPA: hypothetical protein VG407_00030 [Caulobacteraceae bacterium]|jgi:hypothetical protein|nr:hypothetical protein [Caulobacteraceae bacterium]